VQLFNDDCLKILPTIPENTVDLIVTTPPYNMRTRVTHGTYTTRDNSKHFSKKHQSL
jgi:DNA modification methylase